jgi:hypothetical protein
MIYYRLVTLLLKGGIMRLRSGEITALGGKGAILYYQPLPGRRFSIIGMIQMLVFKITSR